MSINAPRSTILSAAEATIRRDLAACFRIVAMHGWDDLVATHISARLPGEEAFLLNPFGLLFEEITASSLVKLDAEGRILEDTSYQVNRAGFVIHSAIHQARSDAGCVMHLHTADGVAVSTLQEGLLPLSQTAMLLNQDIAYHDYEGVAVDVDERERLATDLGNRNLMILRNHGTLGVGTTIGECFTSMYFLETSCTFQVRALGMGRAIHNADTKAIDRTAAFRNQVGSRVANDVFWPALLRKVERLQPDFAA